MRTTTTTEQGQQKEKEAMKTSEVTQEAQKNRALIEQVLTEEQMREIEAVSARLYSWMPMARYERAAATFLAGAAAAIAAQERG